MHTISRGILALAFAGAVAMLAPQWASAATTVWAVGDGAAPTSTASDVARLIQTASPNSLLYLGDVYENGTSDEFARNYDPTYGRFKSITKPTPGNHEWANRATGYDPYWGPSYSSPHYYSFDTGDWHFVSLNSEEPSGDGSAELAWLRADLAAHPGTCTVAYWHRPRYSAPGGHGDQIDMDRVWQALAGHASLVLNGHDHVYERFQPIGGITEMVVGTGGKSLYSVDAADTRLAASPHLTYGALRLSFTHGHVDYAFVDTSGAMLDSGSLACLDTVAPSIDGVSLLKRRIRIHKRQRARVSFTLSEAATVELQLDRRVDGDRFRQVGVIRRSLTAGRHTLLIPRSRRPGSMRVTLKATDSVGNSSPPVTATLRIVR